MKLTDLQYLIEPFEKVKLFIDDYENNDSDTEVKGPINWCDVGYMGYEIITIYVADGILQFRCRR